MTKREVQDSIEKALKAIRAYKTEELEKLPKNKQITEEQELRKSIDGIIKESYMLGSAGGKCPTCGGSGRV
jgi:glycerol dehydrogenase-like iron-containing ADH family enzyme